MVPEDDIRQLFDQLPSGIPPPVDELKARARTRRRRRRLGVAIAGLAASTSLALIAIASLRDGTDDTQTVTAASPSVQPPTSPSTSTPTTAATPRGLSFDQPLPPAWLEIPGPQYVDLGELPTARASATVANYEFAPEISRICDEPVAALEALPPTGAFVSVVDAVAGAAFFEPRPSSEAFLPGPSEVELYAEFCLNRAADFRFAETGFFENGRMVRVMVGLGQDADSVTEAQVLEIIDQLVVQPR